MSSPNVKEFTDQNFKDQVLSSPLPVVVDFWAPWCGPCKMLTPIIDDLAQAYDGTVVFGKVNVDDNPQIASKYGVMNIPTILFFKAGNPIDQQVGLLAKPALKNRIDKLIV
jgi:thioredoxin 1